MCERCLISPDVGYWRCLDCGCLNRDHEAFCYRCGACFDRCDGCNEVAAGEEFEASGLCQRCLHGPPIPPHYALPLPRSLERPALQHFAASDPVVDGEPSAQRGES